MINYENNVLPIINLVNKFRLIEQNEVDRKIIVVRRKDSKFGILVDGVSEVLNISTDEIKNPHSLKTLISPRYIKGLIKRKESITIMIDLEKILTVEEEEIIFQG